MRPRTFDPKRVRPRPLVAALLIGTGVGVVGCGDSSTEPGDELKPSEAEALYDALVGMIRFAISDPSNPVPAASVTRSCSRGGEVTVSTEVEFGADGAGRVSWGIAPDACGVSSRGWEFKLDGNPDVLIAVAVRFSEDFTESVIDGSMTGGVHWELDDRSGTCMIDLIISGGSVQNFAEPQAFGTATGTMCGLDVEFDG